ncbi:MAG: nucleoside deaminase [Candidatus Symbiothrix sp.]|jgi:tRNA(Arg) A34 adenosine deaminase TadA|nr:nucleoside deaminase [Candidatus Symbiothrix sp.]
MNETDKKWMRKAIRLSLTSVAAGGGPFGAVIVKDGKEVASGHNMVTLKNDPTAHAEVSAIRKAAKKLNTFDLSGCEIYTSCEPCPMCLSAIYWSRIDKIYYANTKSDAKNIGFDDSFIYDQLELPKEKRAVPITQMLRNEAIEAFETWSQKTDKIEY